jgi:hypothetical protein
MAPCNVEMPPPKWFDESDAAWASPPPIDFARICGAVITGMIEGFQAEAERLKGRRTAPVEAAVAARIEQAKPQRRLSELWASYRNDRMAIKKWAASSLKKYEGFQRLFLDILGDCELRCTIACKT